MNPSIFKPKELVENFVEKIAAAHPLASVLAAAKNAAPVQMLAINVVFSMTYGQSPMAFGRPQRLFVAGDAPAPNTPSFAHR
jgi:hypothetical protein